MRSLEIDRSAARNDISRTEIAVIIWISRVPRRMIAC
jgi:hypothetical protein